jgi:hypothetical protein
VGWQKPRPHLDLKRILGKADTSFTPDFCNKIGPDRRFGNVRFCAAVGG